MGADVLPDSDQAASLLVDGSSPNFQVLDHRSTGIDHMVLSVVVDLPSSVLDLGQAVDHSVVASQEQPQGQTQLA